MKKRTTWDKLKMGFGLKVKNSGEIVNQEWVRKQFVEILRLGSNPIVMQMGNR